MESKNQSFKNGGYTVEKHHKEAFEKIPPDKRERIRKAAATEFAAKGFPAANINVIARNAGISVGSMYNYFQSKEDLFLSLVDYGYQVLEQVLAGIDLEQGSIFDKIEKMLRAAQKYAREYPELNQIYLDIATEGLAGLSKQLSRKMETIAAKFYRALLTLSKIHGTVPPDLDEGVTAFCLDNLILMLQYSYTTEYFKERMRIFIGPDACEDDEKIIQGLMRFIRGGLSMRVSIS